MSQPSANMSWFSGKKFRRVRCENVDEILNSKNATEQVRRLIIDTPPVVSFQRLDEVTFQITLERQTVGAGEGKLYHFSFKIGEERELERLDGSKVKLLYYLEADNIMKQTVTLPDGKKAYFTREFSETEAKLTMYVDGTDLQAVIYYEVVP